MITIRKDGDHINITGHSQPDVCSAVSSVMYTSVNLLAKYNKDSIKFQDNSMFDFVAIDIQCHDEIIDLIIDNMFAMFKDIEETSPMYVKIIG